MAAGGGNRVGYEYDYRFSVDDKIVQRYGDDIEVIPGKKTYLFEIRTAFIIVNKYGQQNDHLISSEKYDGLVNDDGDVHPKKTSILTVGFNEMVSYRLAEYWMPQDQIYRFDRDAIDFARKAAAARAADDIIPIAADVEVLTVQLGGEPIEEALNRAIRAEDLIPIYLLPLTSEVERVECDHYRASDVMYRLRRTRVGSAGEGRALMSVCSICERAPTLGTQITVLPWCSHAFHSRCVALWLMDHDVCPSCRTPAPFRDLPLVDI